MVKRMFHKLVAAEKAPHDFYVTPRSLIWVVQAVLQANFDKTLYTLDPCSGEGALSEELQKLGYKVVVNDIRTGGVDYLTQRFIEVQVVMNPPFTLWDEFIEHAKLHAWRVLSIGRLNYFGAYRRHQRGLWQHLKAVYAFNRCIDYRTPPRLDGHFYHGGFATGWFLWDMQYTGKPMLEILDVQPYCTLGKFANSERDAVDA